MYYACYSRVVALYTNFAHLARGDFCRFLRSHRSRSGLLHTSSARSSIRRPVSCSSPRASLIFPKYTSRANLQSAQTRQLFPRPDLDHRSRDHNPRRQRLSARPDADSKSDGNRPSRRKYSIEVTSTCGPTWSGWRYASNRDDSNVIRKADSRGSAEDSGSIDIRSPPYTDAQVVGPLGRPGDRVYSV